MPEDGKLSGHAVLIAGGAGGLGFALGMALAAEGCELHLADTDETALEEAGEAITDLYDIVLEEHPTDLSESVNAAVLALECEDAGIVVNTIGSAPGGALESLEAEDWRDGFELRLFGAVNLCREMLESMTERGSGVIVNVGLPEADGDPERICPLTVNAALAAFSTALDRQYKPQGIRVLTFFPEAGAPTEDNAAVLSRLIFSKMSS